MMKLVYLCIGCIPLMWVTLSTLMSRDTGASARSDVAATKFDLASAEARTGDLSQDVIDEIPFFEGLTSIEPFAETLIDVPYTRHKKFKSFKDAWQEYKNAHSAVQRLQRIYPQKTLPKSATETSELASFLAANPFDGVSRGQSLANWCQDRREEIQRFNTSSESVEIIRSEFAKGNWEATLMLLKKLSRDQLAPAVVLEMKKIERMAEFAQYWRDFPLTPIPPALGEVKKRAAKLEEKLKGSPSLLDENDVVDESRKATYERRKQELRELQWRIKADDIFEVQYDSFTALARECDRVFQEEAETQPRLYERMKKWIDERFVEKKPPKFDKDEKEAWQLDGVYRRGVFKPVNGFASLPVAQQYYKYWQNPIKFRMQRPFDLEIYVKDLAAAPDEMLEIRLCKKYNDMRNEFIKKSDPRKKPDDIRQAWQNFAFSCDEMQKQLTDYYIKISADKQDVSFQEESLLADEIAKNWAHVEYILKPPR